MSTRHGETWVVINDQEWALLQFLREINDKTDHPPAFDLAASVHGATVVGSVRGEELRIDGSARLMIRHAGYEEQH